MRASKVAIGTRERIHSGNDPSEVTGIDIVGRKVEVCVIENIEEACPDDRLESLGRRNVLVQRYVSIKIAGPAEGVARQVSKVCLLSGPEELRLAETR